MSAEIQEIIGTAEYEYEKDIGFFAARDVIEKLNIANFIIVHTDVCPYKSQEDADAVLAAYRAKS